MQQITRGYSTVCSNLPVSWHHLGASYFPPRNGLFFMETSAKTGQNVESAFLDTAGSWSFRDVARPVADFEGWKLKWISWSKPANWMTYVWLSVSTCHHVNICQYMSMWFRGQANLWEPSSRFVRHELRCSWHHSRPCHAFRRGFGLKSAVTLFDKATQGHESQDTVIGPS